MLIKGSNYYFKNYEEVLEFLLNKGFKYSVPRCDEEALREGRYRYCVEVRNDKVVFAAIERIGSGMVYNTNVFYDNTRAYNFELSKDGEIFRLELKELEKINL